MEVSALKYSGGIGLHARSPLLRLQSDERLVALVRRGNNAAFEALVARFESRLLAFCRHLLGSREDAEDVLQEVLAAAYNAMLADERPINVKPWLYRIARNRSLNHLRRIQAIGVDSMDVHLSDQGQSTADKVHEREEFRLLVGDIHELPESQKTALVLREMDALSYEQIAEAMEATVPSVKSLLVRARVSLAEAAEARLLSCEEVRIELGEMAEGLRRRPSPLVRRHMRACARCTAFREQLKDTNRALAAVLPIGPLVILKKLVLTHVGHSAGSSATGAGAAGSGAAAGGTLVAGSTTGGFVSAGVGAIATKAAAGLAAAALVTGAAVEVDHTSKTPSHKFHPSTLAASVAAQSEPLSPSAIARSSGQPASHRVAHAASAAPAPAKPKPAPSKPAPTAVTPKPSLKAALVQRTTTTSATTTTTTTTSTTTSSVPTHVPPATPPVLPGRTQTQTDPTVLAAPPEQTVTTTETTTSAPGPLTSAPPSGTATSSSTTETEAPSSAGTAQAPPTSPLSVGEWPGTGSDGPPVP